MILLQALLRLQNDVALNFVQFKAMYIFTQLTVFSERELTFTYAICRRRPSVVCRLSVMFVRPTQAIEIFGNILRSLVHWPSMTFV